jgi:hypothetical protein
MAVADREMADARRRLSKNLAEPSITDALSVLDKAVTGLIDLAKGRDAAEGASGKRLDSPFGKNKKNPYGLNDYDLRPGSVGEKLISAKGQESSQKTSKKVVNDEDDEYDPGNAAAAMGFSMKKGGYDEDLQAGWDDMGKAEDDEDEDEGDEDDDEDEEDNAHERRESRAQERREHDDDDDDDDDEEDDDEEGDDDEEDESKGWDEDGDDGDDDEEDESKGWDDMDKADDDDDDDEDDDGEEDDVASRMARLRAMQGKKKKPAEDDDEDDDEEPMAESMYRSYSVNDIHKALVAGPNGARVAEVVEASRELAHMVNVFSKAFGHLSGQVDQIRRDQRNATTILADAVNTVVKSQSAIAVGLERMAKSTAVLAKSGGPTGLSKSLSKSGIKRPQNPGVVMNGKVMAEGAALRRSNAMIDESGSVVVPNNQLETRLTKSVVGGVIQQAVLDGEFSAKDALRWLTETDSPASGPVAVYRQLPAKLQDRIARKADEE